MQEEILFFGSLGEHLIDKLIFLYSSKVISEVLALKFEDHEEQNALQTKPNIVYDGVMNGTTCELFFLRKAKVTSYNTLTLNV